MSFSARDQGIARQSYEDALAACSRVATDEFSVAQAAFRGAQLVVANIQRRLPIARSGAQTNAAGAVEANCRILAGGSRNRKRHLFAWRPRHEND
jgi:hypothetical protein